MTTEFFALPMSSQVIGLMICLAGCAVFIVVMVGLIIAEVLNR